MDITHKVAPEEIQKKVSTRVYTNEVHNVTLYVLVLLPQKEHQEIKELEFQIPSIFFRKLQKLYRSHGGNDGFFYHKKDSLDLESEHAVTKLFCRYQLSVNHSSFFHSQAGQNQYDVVHAICELLNFCLFSILRNRELLIKLIYQNFKEYVGYRYLFVESRFETALDCQKCFVEGRRDHEDFRKFVKGYLNKISLCSEVCLGSLIGKETGIICDVLINLEIRKFNHHIHSCVVVCKIPMVHLCEFDHPIFNRLFSISQRGISYIPKIFLDFYCFSHSSPEDILFIEDIDTVNYLDFSIFLIEENMKRINSAFSKVTLCFQENAVFKYLFAESEFKTAVEFRDFLLSRRGDTQYYKKFVKEYVENLSSSKFFGMHDVYFKILNRLLSGSTTLTCNVKNSSGLVDICEKHSCIKPTIDEFVDFTNSCEEALNESRQKPLYENSNNNKRLQGYRDRSRKKWLASGEKALIEFRRAVGVLFVKIFGNIEETKTEFTPNTESVCFYFKMTLVIFDSPPSEVKFNMPIAFKLFGIVEHFSRSESLELHIKRDGVYLCEKNFGVIEYVNQSTKVDVVPLARIHNQIFKNILCYIFCCEDNYKAIAWRYRVYMTKYIFDEKPSEPVKIAQFIESIFPIYEFTYQLHLLCFLGFKCRNSKYQKSQKLRIFKDFHSVFNFFKYHIRDKRLGGTGEACDFLTEIFPLVMLHNHKKLRDLVVYFDKKKAEHTAIVFESDEKNYCLTGHPGWTLDYPQDSNKVMNRRGVAKMLRCICKKLPQIVIGYRNVCVKVHASESTCDDYRNKLVCYKELSLIIEDYKKLEESPSHFELKKVICKIRELAEIELRKLKSKINEYEKNNVQYFILFIEMLKSLNILNMFLSGEPEDSLIPTQFRNLILNKFNNPPSRHVAKKEPEKVAKAPKSIAKAPVLVEMNTLRLIDYIYNKISKHGLTIPILRMLFDILSYKLSDRCKMLCRARHGVYVEDRQNDQPVECELYKLKHVPLSENPFIARGKKHIGKKNNRASRKDRCRLEQLESVPDGAFKFFGITDYVSVIATVFTNGIVLESNIDDDTVTVFRRGARGKLPSSKCRRLHKPLLHEPLLCSIKSVVKHDDSSESDVEECIAHRSAPLTDVEKTNSVSNLDR